MDEKLHYIVVTGIIVKGGKYLIAKRSPSEAAFPNLWTVPGGKLRQDDYVKTKKDTSDSWYNVLEKLLEREIEEEVGLRIKNTRYLLSLAYKRSDDIPTLILSFYCDYASGNVKLSKELVEFAWIEQSELSKYDFIPGLREEIEMVDRALAGGDTDSWRGKYDNHEDKSVRDG